MTTGSRTIRFDPHVHTNASYDAVGTVDEVLAAAEDAHLDALAITDHDTVEAAIHAEERAAAYDVCVVRGVEVSTADGHLLALGVAEVPPVGAPIKETVAWVRSEGGVAVVPHPFQRTRHGVRKRDVPAADGIEIFNAWSMTGIQNRRAKLFAKRNDFPCLGGSDAHDPGMVGRAHTDVLVQTAHDGPLDSRDVCDALRRGETSARGTTASAFDYLEKYTTSMRLKTRTTVQRAVFGAD